MKKIILGLSALACLAITSCSSDDNNKEETVIVESTAQKIVGNWKYITGIVIIEGETRIEDLKVEDCDYDYLNLKPDGSKDDVFHDAEDNCATENFVGTWVYDEENNTITTIDTEDNYKMIFEVTEISSNAMKIRLINMNGMVVPDVVEIYSILEK